MVVVAASAAGVVAVAAVTAVAIAFTITNNSCLLMVTKTAANLFF